MTAAQGQALENAIVANPDDLGAHAAYADWLIEQGDPRGEFIAVQLALEDEKQPAEERARLQARERALLFQHGQQWLGALGRPVVVQPGLLRRLMGVEKTRALPAFDQRFARGWLDQLRTEDFDGDLAAALASEPASRLLRRLELIGSDDYEPPLDVLAGSRFLGNLRFFQLGRDDDNCHISGEEVIDVILKLPRLEELHLLAHHIDTPTLFGLHTLTNLRVLHVDHARDYALDVLAGNPALGKLERLSCWPHAIEPGETAAYISLADVRAVASSPHLKSLKHLALRLTDAGDAGCRALVESGLLARLQTLDLSRGRIGDEGARILAACPDLRSLQLLNLSENCLTPAGEATLRATGVHLTASEQWQPGADPDANHEYLYYGDIE